MNIMKRLFITLVFCIISILGMMAKNHLDQIRHAISGIDKKEMIKGPAIEFKELIHDFGKIPESGGKVTYGFTLTNTGDEELVIYKIRASCGCTAVKYSAEPVHPGKSSVITASYNPKGRPGSFLKTITIATNAGDVLLRIKGEVIPASANQPLPKSTFESDLRDAQSGDVESMFWIGMSYSIGEEVEQNDAEALEWFRKAAEKGHTDAQYYLGYYYANGIVVDTDYAESAKWYLKAAKQGQKHAQYYLGLDYATGWGVEQNMDEAVKWWHKAAAQGESRAQYNLGICYEIGEGVEENIEEAKKWYIKAANNNNEEAMSALKRLNIR